MDFITKKNFCHSCAATVRPRPFFTLNQFQDLVYNLKW